MKAVTAGLEPNPPVAHYDAITLECERIEALAHVLEGHLLEKSESDHADELYALSVVAGVIRAKHQIIRAEALKLLHCAPGRKPKGGAR